MKKSTIILVMFALPMVFAFATPCFASAGLPGLGGLAGLGGGAYSLGAGFMFPDVKDVSKDSALYYSLDMTASDFLVEVDYVNSGDLQAWLMNGDYKYPLTGLLSSEAYLGFGYTYLVSDNDALKNSNGINVCVGLNVVKKIDVHGRYLFLGGGDHILMAGATLSF